MARLRLVTLALGVLSIAAARSGGVPIDVTMDEYGQEDLTTLFRADLSDAEGTFESVTIKDKNTAGGSSGVFSGFDIDFLFFDRDGNLATTDDRILPLENELTHMEQRGVMRKGAESVYQPTSAHPGPLFGLNVDGSIDFDTATLGVRDATYEPGRENLTVDTSGGFVSLGDGGEIRISFPLFYVEGQNELYLFLGDVGLRDEYPDTSSEIQIFVGEQIELPVLDPNVCPECTLLPGESVKLNAAGEQVADPIVSWKWDLDGDGEYDDGTGDVLAVSFEYLAGLGLPINEMSLIGLETQTASGGVGTCSVGITLVPEPTTGLLVAVGGLAAVLRRRRRAGRGRREG